MVARKMRVPRSTTTGEQRYPTMYCPFFFFLFFQGKYQYKYTYPAGSELVFVLIMDDAAALRDVLGLHICHCSVSQRI